MDILKPEWAKDLIRGNVLKNKTALPEGERLMSDDWEEERLQEVVEKEKKESFLEAMEKEDIINMRRLWSGFLLLVVFFVVVFDSIIFIGIGMGWFNYTDKVVPIFIVESLLKTLGLALIVVKFLFHEKSLK